MKYLTRDEIRNYDKEVIKNFQIPSILLMENAGRGATEEIVKFIESKFDSTPSICILCGKGNNGGDGAVIARHLFTKGFKPTIVYLNKLNANKEQNDATINLNIAKNMNIHIIEYHPHEEQLPPIINSSDLLIDAIFGTGLKDLIRTPYDSIFNKINNLNKPIIAIDIPSGLDCNTGAPLGVAIKADLTITMAFPKIGFKQNNADIYTGEIVTVGLGI